MLPKKHRLPLRSLPNFFSTAQKQHTPFFTFFYIKTQDHTQAAVIVPKKTFLKASKRNNVKRVIQNFLQTRISGQTGLQLVVFVKPAAADLHFDELLTHVEKAYDQINKNLSNV